MKTRRQKRQQKRQSRKLKRSRKNNRKTLRRQRRQRGGDLPVPNGAVIGLTMRSDKIDDPDAIPVFVRKEEIAVEED